MQLVTTPTTRTFQCPILSKRPPSDLHGSALEATIAKTLGVFLAILSAVLSHPASAQVVPVLGAISQLTSGLAALEAKVAALQSENRTLSQEIQQLRTEASETRAGVNTEFAKLSGVVGFQHRFSQVFRPGNPGAPGTMKRCNEGEFVAGLQTYYDDGYNKYAVFCASLPKLAIK